MSSTDLLAQSACLIDAKFFAAVELTFTVFGAHTTAQASGGGAGGRIYGVCTHSQRNCTSAEA